MRKSFPVEDLARDDPFVRVPMIERFNDRLNNEPRRRRAPAKAQDSVGQRVTGESTHQ